MITKTPLLVLALVASLASACGSGTSTGTSSGTSGVSPSGPNDPVALPGGGVVPNVACGDESVVSANGTWDVLVSGARRQGTAALLMENGSFVLTQETRSFAFTVNGSNLTLMWTEDAKQSPITVTHGDSALATGIVPVAIGGNWTFASTTGPETCTGALTANSLNGTCTKVRRTPFGTLDGTVVGLRQQSKSSVFGELGGVWHFTGSGGDGSLDVTFSGNVFTAVATGNTGLLGKGGWTTIKICNGTAAGKTSNGIEIAATRR